MWLITGPFDGDVGDVSVQKTKLLKPNASYSLGRKDVRLLINNKKISGQHGVFKVGQFSADDAANPPSLTFSSSKKTFKITRNGTSINFGLNIDAVLQDGDEITLIFGVTLKVQWKSICCYSAAKDNTWDSGCISLGINMLSTPCPEVTHHLISDYGVTASIATSLISSAQLVKPEWLAEVIRLASLSGDYDRSLGLSLEETFALPPVSKFRPNVPQNLDPTHKCSSVWEPNEERLHIFKDYRFLCVGEKAREVPLDLRRMLERGDGTLESFDVHLGVDKFRRAITRGRVKAHKKLVLVGDEALLSTAVGQDVLHEFAQEAASCNLVFISPDALIQTVLDVDTSKLVPSNESAQVPNTSAEEPSVVYGPIDAPPPPRRRLLRRAASREPSVVPEIVSQDPQPVPRLRRPTRRANQNANMVTGLDDPSSVLDFVPDLDSPAVPAPLAIDLTAPTPGRPKLKRRLRQASVDPTPLESMDGTYEIPDSIREPPLKRFKALFEASDPDKLDQSSSAMPNSQVDTFGGGSSENMATGSQTQTETYSGSRGKIIPSLSVLREEEEESGTGSVETIDSKGKKRRLEDVYEDVVMADSEPIQPHPAKRRTTTSSQVAPASRGVEVASPPPSKARAGSKPPSRAAHVPPPSKSKSKAKSGADPGKPDTDAEFLKAIASTKKGKKREDEFDREFNKLKISKPDLNDEEPEKEWAVLAEFGDDSGLRGNFMTILEMDVFRDRNGQSRTRQNNPGWRGIPNFKKFKKATNYTRSERPKIDLFVNEEDDCGLGATYWKNEASQDQIRLKEPPPKLKPTKRAASAAPAAELFDEDPVDVVAAAAAAAAKGARSRVASSKASSRAGSVAPAPAKKPARRAAPKPIVIDEDEDDAEDLFLEVDSDPIMFDDNDSDDVDTMQSGDSFNRTKSKKAAGSGKKSGGAPKKTRKPVVRDDSDDGAAFKGFGRRKK